MTSTTRNRFAGARWMFVLAAVAAVALSGCDRTRPYGGVQEPVSTPATTKAVDGSAPPAVAPVAPVGPIKTAQGWKFTYSAPQASSIHLAGSFNDWSTTADPLKKGGDGVWTTVKEIGPGTYPYKFVVNGSDWKTDPANPEFVDDGFGGQNSLLVVP